MVNSDTESIVEINDTDDTEAETQRGFTFGDILWDARWIDRWNLFDDLEDWRCDGDELTGVDPPREDMDHAEDSDSNSKGPTEDSSSEDLSEG